jgi:hypothetical protein
MQSHDVEQIVRSVITHYGVPFKLHTVSAASPDGGAWDIALHGSHGAALRFKIFDGTPQAMRHAVLTALEIEG